MCNEVRQKKKLACQSTFASFACSSVHASVIILTSFFKLSRLSRRASGSSSKIPSQPSGWHTRCTIMVHDLWEAIATQSWKKHWQSSSPFPMPSESKGVWSSWSLFRTYALVKLLKISAIKGAKLLFDHPDCICMLLALSFVISKTLKWSRRSGLSAK